MGRVEKPIVGNNHHFQNIIGSSRAMEEIRIQMAEAIDSDTDLLVTGETGTGKELVAREIHYSTLKSSSLYSI